VPKEQVPVCIRTAVSGLFLVKHTKKSRSSPTVSPTSRQTFSLLACLHLFFSLIKIIIKTRNPLPNFQFKFLLYLERLNCHNLPRKKEYTLFIQLQANHLLYGQ